MTQSDYLADEPGYRQLFGGREPMCTLQVDGVTREGYVRAWSARPEADPPGWWAYCMWQDDQGYNHPEWFPASAVTEVPEP